MAVFLSNPEPGRTTYLNSVPDPGERTIVLRPTVWQTFGEPWRYFHREWRLVYIEMLRCWAGPSYGKR